MGERHFLPRYKRVSFIRAKQIDVSVKAKIGPEADKVYALQISNLDRSDFKEQRSANKWVKIPINNHAYLIQAISKYQTVFSDIGEVITELVFSDGRKIRLKSKDLSKNDFLKIFRVMQYSYDGGRKGELKDYCSKNHEPHYCDHSSSKSGNSAEKNGKSLTATKRIRRV